MNKTRHEYNMEICLALTNYLHLHRASEIRFGQALTNLDIVRMLPNLEGYIPMLKHPADEEPEETLKRIDAALERIYKSKRGKED